MPGILKSNVLTYEFSPTALKELIAADMGKRLDEVDIYFNVSDVSDDRFGGSPSYSLTKVTVTVKQPIGK